MSDMAGSDVDWAPPTEAQMKVIAAKRERSDKISKLMGDYLLKGYKMLATTCRDCDTIELKDRAGNVYCVACSEVDSAETGKDDPLRAGGEGQGAAAGGGGGREEGMAASQGRDVPAAPVAVTLERATRGQHSAGRVISEEVDAEVRSALEVVTRKMAAARGRLAVNGDLDLVQNKVLVEFIRECADCITSLKNSTRQSGH